MADAAPRYGVAVSAAETDPLTVFGLHPQASLPEIHERYQVLAQFIRQDLVAGAHEQVRLAAQRRLAQLNLAYEALQAAHGLTPGAATPGAAPGVVFNEPNVPIERLFLPQQSADVAELWLRAGIQPIMIRLDHATGVCLATPTIHDADARTSFLAAQGQLHLARRADALMDLVTGLPSHDLQALGTWRWLASSVRPHHVIVHPSLMYDFPAMLENLADGVDRWRPPLLIPVYDLCYELAIALDIDELQAALAPGTPLYQLYLLIKELAEPWRSRSVVAEKIARFDLLDVFDAWSDISDLLADHLVWHE